MISMKQPFQLLMFTALAFASKNYLDSKIHCVAGDFIEGENAKITCHFHQDLNPEGISINVGHHSSFTFQETGNDILACAFKNGLQGPDCFQRDGYVYDKFTNGTLTLVIPNITKAFEGIYDCRLVSDESIRIPCNLTVTEKLFATSTLSTGDASLNKGLIVGLPVSAVIVVVLIICFLFIRFNNRNKASRTAEGQQKKKWCCEVLNKLSDPDTPTSSKRHDSDITDTGNDQNEEEMDVEAGTIITCKSPFLPLSKEPLETLRTESESVVINMAAAANVADDMSSQQTPNEPLDNVTDQQTPNQPLNGMTDRQNPNEPLHDMTNQQILNKPLNGMTNQQTPNEPLNDMSDQSTPNQPLHDASEQQLPKQGLDDTMDQPPPYQHEIPDKKQSAELQLLYEQALKVKEYLEKIATELDADSQFKKKSKVVGGSVSLAGTAVMVLGAVAAAAATGVIGLPLVVAGAAGVTAAVAGGATTTITKLHIDKIAKDKVEAAKKTLEEFRKHLATYLQEFDINGLLRKRLISDGLLSSVESEVALPTGTFKAVGRTVQAAAQTSSAAVRVVAAPVAFIGLVMNLYDIIDGAVALHKDKKSCAGESIREIISKKVDTLIKLLEEEKKSINVSYVTSWS